jgi:aryl-alcohol dehydrogenase-like predicted oxidoreductase
MANKYNEGETEEIIGEWMKKRGNRDRMVIATKFSIGMRKNDPNAVGNHRKNMFSSVRDSLRRLQTDYIDLVSDESFCWSSLLGIALRALLGFHYSH